MRIYLPTTIEGLRDIVAAGGASPELERYVADDESEEAEYAALMAAADDSATLQEQPARRVVVVADIDDADAVVPMRDVVAVHADVDETGELAWFATQEIGALLDAEAG